jgi:hypothetical protein
MNLFISILVMILFVSTNGFSQTSNSSSDNSSDKDFNIGPNIAAISQTFNPGAVTTPTTQTIAAGSPTTTIGGPIKISHVGSPMPLPPGATVVAQGEVVNIDRNKNQISLRDANGEVSFYAVNDPGVFGNVNEGDQIQIYK